MVDIQGRSAEPPKMCDGTCQKCQVEALAYYIGEAGLDGKALHYLLKALDGMTPTWKPGDPHPEITSYYRKDFPDWIEDLDSKKE